ncbi:MAG: DsbA family oxidoreductase [Pseudomonadota bacterium]
MSESTSISGDKILSLVGDRAVPDQGLTVDIIADVICPWSRIGVQRLLTAIESVHGPAELRWFPFQLNPDMAPDGMALEHYLTSRFGDPKAVEPALLELTKLAAREGATMRFDRITRVPNTFDAHCLLHQAADAGVQTELALAFFNAYYEQGDDLGDPTVLRRIADLNGLDKATIDAAFEDERLRTVVRANEAMARNAGVAGVPNFLVNQRVFVVGAQEHDQLVGAIDRALFGDLGDESETPVMH